MEISTGILREADVLLSAFILGMGMLVVYDLLRIFRRLVRHGAIWVGIEDLFFWIGSALAMFAMLYQDYSGYIRGFIILGVLSGMLVYNLAFSHYVVRASVFILKKLIFVFSRPFAWTLKLFQKPAGALKKIAKKVIRFLKKRLKKLWKTVRIGLCKL